VVLAKISKAGYRVAVEINAGKWLVFHN